MPSPAFRPAPNPSRRAHRRRRLVLLAAAIAAGSTAPVALAQERAKPRPAPAIEDAATAALRRRVEQLRAERDVAAGRAFYLRLDAGRRRLTLMLQGVALDDYPAASVEWGVPQVLFIDRRPAPGWDAGSFSKGHLEPERGRDRLEVVAPALDPSPAAAAAAPAPAASPSAPAVPKSAEELYSVPSPYRIVFAEGVSLEVRARGAGSRNRSVLQRAVDAAGLRLSDLASALGIAKARERVRLRVTLEAEDAASLYRSLPPDVGLVVAGLPPR